MQSLPDDNLGSEDTNELGELFGPVLEIHKKASFKKVLRYSCLLLVLVYGSLEFLEFVDCGNFHSSECRNNLKQLGIALHNYHDAFGTLPPAYIADENGKPMHSWRVLILPQLDEYDLYKQYRFDEPWDGPNNRKLHDKMPRAFLCPSDEDAEGMQFTNYVAVAGKNTVWPYAKAISFKEMKDGLSNTIFVVEMKNSGIHWMEPRDLEFDKMSFKINDPDKPSISSEHKRFAPPHRVWQDDTPMPPQVLMGDGTVRRLPLDICKDLLKALLTINGGEKIDYSSISD